MATGKNKIIFYRSWADTFKKLSVEEAGKLILHFCKYITDENPEPPDRITDLLFDPIKDTLKRDLKSWESRVQVNKANGLNGGRPKTEKTQSVNLGLEENPKKGDKDKDKDKDKVNVKDKDSVIKKHALDFRNEINLLYPTPSSFEKMELDKFYDYWTEPNKSGTKLKYQMQTTWDLKRRIDTWFRNAEKFNPTGNKVNGNNIDWDKI